MEAEVMTPSADSSDQNLKKVSKRRKRRPRGGKRRGIAAPVVFYGVGAICSLGLGAFYMLGKDFFAIPVLTSTLILYVLYVNDRRGFIRSRQMRRAYQARGHFHVIEVLVLLGLLCATVLVTAFVLIR